MPVDDESKTKLELLKSDSEGFVGEEAFNAALSMLPVVGAPILSVMYDLSQKRMRARVLDVLEEFDKRLRDKAVDREFFKSDEFHNLLFIAMEQLRTSNDEERRKMLAAGLANSCVSEFASETRKELFLQVLRDLSSAHIRVLKKLFGPSDYNPQVRRLICDPNGEELAVLQHLTASGLVEEYNKQPNVSIPWRIREMSVEIGKEVVEKAIKQVLEKNFKISQFGIDFMKYFAVSSHENGPPCQP